VGDRRRGVLINPYCSQLGERWLFDDIRDHFNAHPSGLVRATEDPLLAADRYICIRATELSESPDIARTIVQLHCNEPRLWGSTEMLRRAAGFVFTHPSQPRLLLELGVPLDKPSLLRPVGALDCFTLRENVSRLCSFGWVGRDTGAKRIELFVDAVKMQPAMMRVVMAGANLVDRVRQIRNSVADWELYPRSVTPIDYYPAIYRTLDAVVITSANEAGPMCLYESLACGVPVIATRCGWTEHFIVDGVNGFLIDEGVDKVREIAHRMAAIAQHRGKWFARRHYIRASLGGWSMDEWIRDNVKLATEV
jgi:glycosyltransferase involved in cell wall biosynthesis